MEGRSGPGALFFFGLPNFVTCPLFHVEQFMPDLMKISAEKSRSWKKTL
jgi:hypothetical protein